MDYIPDADDVKDIPSRAFLVGGDARKRYFVSGDLSDGKPKKVLIVMPGGAGSPDFHPFVKRIQKNCLDGGWIVAEPIAPVWSQDENRVVWPCVGVPYASAAFTTESFIDGILDDLPAETKAPISEVYMLGWSSSGPAIYSYAAHGGHQIAGSFIAMSIFNPGLFGSTTDLKTKRFYLLHSPQDFIPIAQAKDGEATLTRMKVPVHLATYEGGHGWHGPVYDEIADGLKFLTAKN
jgi:predicted esterase